MDDLRPQDNGLLWPEGPPQERWHSFDATPWLHPWLTRANLSAMREASAGWREEARRVVERCERLPDRIAFVGNIANGMYERARSYKRAGASIDVFGLYSDDAVFSDPRWAEYDGPLPDDVSWLGKDKSFLAAVEPSVHYAQFTMSADQELVKEPNLPPYLRRKDLQRWQPYFCHFPAMEALQPYDAVFAVQAPYLAYLSGRPYAATQMGGDLGLEASRDDLLGRLQRTAYREAGCVLVHNPWTFAHARRFGLNNLIYLPYTLDEVAYSPGAGRSRREWEERSGGDFFVLITARADDYYKGTFIGLRGFAEFCRRFPGARLIVTAWGNDIALARDVLAKLGIADRALFVPIAGKRKLVDYLRSADCLVDQFRVGYFGSTALEGAACGLPVIMRFEQAQYDSLCETGAPPFLNAATSNEVADALEMLAASPARRAENADASRRWFLDNFSGARWWPELRAVLGALALGHRFSFDSSPLNAELSPVERLYHAEQRLGAPPFPKYEVPIARFADIRGHPSDYPNQLEASARLIEAATMSVDTLQVLRSEVGILARAQDLHELKQNLNAVEENIGIKLGAIGQSLAQMTALAEAQARQPVDRPIVALARDAAALFKSAIRQIPGQRPGPPK